jgi:hypothetical protein
VLALEQHPLPVGERHERHRLIAPTQWVARRQDHDELLPTERLQRTLQSCGRGPIPMSPLPSTSSKVAGQQGFAMAFGILLAR